MIKHFRKTRFVLATALLVASLAFAAPTADLPFGPWTRASSDPILSPQGTTWESAGTFNPAVVLHNGKFVMLYRAQDASGTSRLGYAEGTDGIHFTRRPDPVLSSETDYEKDGGVEDPRLQNSATSSISPTPATTKKTRNSASPPPATLSTGGAKA